MFAHANNSNSTSATFGTTVLSIAATPIAGKSRNTVARRGRRMLRRGERYARGSAGAAPAALQLL